MNVRIYPDDIYTCRISLLGYSRNYKVTASGKRNLREERLCISNLSECPQGLSTWLAATGLSCHQQVPGERQAEREDGRREPSGLTGTQASETQVRTAVRTHATHRFAQFVMSKLQLHFFF